MSSKDNKSDVYNTSEIFDKFKSSILNIDPVRFCENYFTLDGNPFRIRGNGYKPFVDIYRYIGIKCLDNNSKPVVLVKGRQVGATTMGINLELYWVTCGLFGKAGRSPMRILHCFPQLDLATYYSKNKLSPAISASKPIGGDGRNKGKSFVASVMDNLNSESIYSKNFENGNCLFVDSIGVDGTRVRGRTYDCIFFDEVQDMFQRAIANTNKTLAQSKYGPVSQGIQVYMGTPKAKDSKYYEMWVNSTQAYYHLGCKKCKKHFPLYTTGSNDWESIWLDEDDPKCESFDPRQRGFIVECVHCGHLQDKREAAEIGKWIYTKPESDCKYIGFHINQLYMPNYPKHAIVAQKPENNPLSDEMLWNNEVLGEFYSGNNATITAEEIKLLCGDFERPLLSSISKDQCDGDNNVYLGIDWGKKIDDGKGTGGQSYSTVVILQTMGPKLFFVQFATKLVARDLSYKKEVINHLMNTYNVKRAVGDIGYGHEIMGEFQQQYGLRIIASESGGTKIRGRIKFDDNDFPKTIRFQKDEQISEMFRMFKDGCVRFPLKGQSWEKIAWLITHCASMIAKPICDRYGNIKIKYFKGITPNDGLMALINAYLAYKFDATNGFKNSAKLYSEKPKDQKKALAVGIYLPKMRVTG